VRGRKRSNARKKNKRAQASNRKRLCARGVCRERNTVRAKKKRRNSELKGGKRRKESERDSRGQQFEQGLSGTVVGMTHPSKQGREEKAGLGEGLVKVEREPR